MKPKKHLSFTSLRRGFSELLHSLPDNRQQAKVNYSIHDAMMSGFACMYFQDPSLAQFQKQLEEEQDSSNLQTLFAVEKLMNTDHIRDIIDDVNSNQLSPVFTDYFSRLQRSKQLEQYQLFPDIYLCSIDGTGYFSSTNIHCSNCLTTQHKNGDITYSHKVLQAAIMHPDVRQIIPLMPEEIRNTDGNSKQDCEVNAAKRLIPKMRKDHPKLNLIITGDGLFSKQPFISQILSDNMHYILVAKPLDHTYMMDWIDAYDEGDLNTIRSTDNKGKFHVYEWINNVPLNGGKDSINVNFFRYKIISQDKNGNEKINYKNSWVTDLAITRSNVVTLVKGGRCKWKIENECFNTLKNQGYHIEHNYGHGKKNLCFNFYLLTLLAFYSHQVLELTDHFYQACRKKFSSKRHMWENLRSYIRLLIFKTWEHLLDFTSDPKKYNLSCSVPSG